MQLTGMVSDEWFDSVERLVTFLDDIRFEGSYEVDIEVEDWFEDSIEVL